jgi:hypothetical protein
MRRTEPGDMTSVIKNDIKERTKGKCLYYQITKRDINIQEYFTVWSSKLKFLSHNLIIYPSARIRETSVVIAAGYVLDGPCSITGNASTSGSNLGSNQPPIPWVPGVR